MTKPVQENHLASLLHGKPASCVSSKSGSSRGITKTPSYTVQSAKGWVHQYRKLEVIGRGSVAKVRLCERADGAQFAMKIFHKSLLKRRRHWDSETERFADGFEDVLREVALMKKLRHPNLVRLHEVIDDPEKDKLYLILDYVPGGPLMSSARSQPALAEEEARRCLRDVVAGLSYLHFHGIAHQARPPSVPPVPPPPHQPPPPPTRRSSGPVAGPGLHPGHGRAMPRILPLWAPPLRSGPEAGEPAQGRRGAGEDCRLWRGADDAGEGASGASREGRAQL